MSQLPESWEQEKLGKVLYKTENIDPRKKPETEFEYIDVSSVSRSTFSIESTSRLKGKDAPSRARKLVTTGDVLFATIRPTLQRIAIVPDALNCEVCSTGYYVLRPKEIISNRFLYYFLFTDSFMSEMERRQKGTSYPAVNNKDVQEQVISFPPLPEQKRLVSILDEAFTGIDQAIANTEKNLANARELFESYLNNVFTQKDDGWEEEPLEKNSKFIDYRGRTPKKTESGLRLITAKNVRMGYLQQEPREYVEESTYDGWMTRGIPRKGDVLFTTEAPLGLVCQLDTNEKVVFAQRIITLQVDRKIIHPLFLSFALRSPLLQKRIQEKGTGATAKGIKSSLLKKILIPKPSLSLQIEIAKNLSNVLSSTLSLESIYQQKLNSLQELKQSILQKAFTGELTKDYIQEQVN